MATKSCPSCGESVPSEAPRCKHCFHDFTAAPPRRSNGLVGLLGLIAAMAVIGAGVFWYVGESRAQERIIVDEETKSIVFTTKYANRTETDRVRFEDVTKIELVIGGDDALYEVYAVTLDGDRRLINESDDKPLKGYAQKIAEVLEKPMVEDNRRRGFGPPPPQQ